MRIVVALGGNALLERGESPDARIELRHIRSAATALASIVNEHDVVICHGNGPQVGLLAAESDADDTLTVPYPLDVLGAQTQGMIGYWLSQALRNAGVKKPILSITTQVCVDPDDAAFAAPTKFIGPVYSHADAAALARKNGWTIGADGSRWRRTVPSPHPIRIVEQESITRLLHGGTVVICGGGGGAPVVETADGRLAGVEAVVDKDFTAALIAMNVHADRLLVLTDVSAVIDHFGTLRAHPLGTVYTDELTLGQFSSGSMRPKIDACRIFVTATGHSASIGSLADASSLLAGTAGTRIADRVADDVRTGRHSA